MKRITGMFLAAVLCLTSVGPDLTSAAQVQAEPQTSLQQTETAETEENSQPGTAADAERAETTGAAATGEDAKTAEMAAAAENADARLAADAAVTDFQAVYDADRAVITLTYSTDGCAYVKIAVNGTTEAEKYTGTTYLVDDVKEGETYTFQVTGYNAQGEAGAQAAGELTVPYKAAVLTSVDVDYNLEKEVLMIDWDGTGIASVDIYRDDVLAAEHVTSDVYVANIKFEPKSKHTFRVVPYNKAGQAGTAKTVEYTIDDYTAKVDSVEAVYDENTRQVTIKWDTSYAEYVDVSLNDVDILAHYDQNSYTFPCTLQPGAPYIVEVTPYNSKGEEGQEATDDIATGSFEVPDISGVTLVSAPDRDADGNYTGYTRPAVNVQWEADADAYYEVYRADKDSKKAYGWIATVRADKDGTYTYQDSTVGVGTAYYKVRRKIALDAYITQELYTSLSDADEINVYVPKASVKAELCSDGQVDLTVTSSRDYVSGYEIYRKESGGKYIRLADITGDTYTDKTAQFGKNYTYRARAFYYDTARKRTDYGKYSKTKTVKNRIGVLQAQAAATDVDEITVSWSPAANAEGYEVYYKSAAEGDSYVLWLVTKKLSAVRTVTEGAKAEFMIKAYAATAKGKTYFSSAEVSCTTGFGAPGGFTVADTSYSTQADGTLVQNDKLTWNCIYGADGYYLEKYDVTTGKYIRVAKISKYSKTSYTVSTPLNSQTAGTKAAAVKYRISAYSDNSIKKGKTVTITPQFGRAEGVAVRLSGTKAKLKWKKVYAAESYIIYRSNGRTMIPVGETTANAYTDQGLVRGASYSYYVQAVNRTRKFTGEKSEAVRVTVPLKNLSGLTAQKSSKGVTLSWQEASDADGYVIYRREKGEKFYQKIAEVKASKNRYVDTTCDADTSCVYRVAAVKTVNGAAAESKGKTVKVK